MNLFAIITSPRRSLTFVKKVVNRKHRITHDLYLYCDNTYRIANCLKKFINAFDSRASTTQLRVTIVTTTIAFIAFANDVVLVNTIKDTKN